MNNRNCFVPEYPHCVLSGFPPVNFQAKTEKIGAIFLDKDEDLQGISECLWEILAVQGWIGNVRGKVAFCWGLSIVLLTQKFSVRKLTETFEEFYPNNLQRGACGSATLVSLWVLESVFSTTIFQAHCDCILALETTQGVTRNSVWRADSSGQMIWLILCWI